MNTLLRFLVALLLSVGCASNGEGLRAAPAPGTLARASVPALPLADARIPPEARQVLAFVREHRSAPPGHVGGRRFGNFEGVLPKSDGRGRRIVYQEWDIRPRVPGRGRGAQRLVTGSDGRAWYTGNHYESFTEIKEPR